MGAERPRVNALTLGAVLNFNQGERSVDWKTLNSTDTDPVSENNIATMVFRIKPQVIPTTSFWSLLGLIGLIIFSLMRSKQLKD